jgi:cytochrome c peroxidase
MKYPLALLVSSIAACGSPSTDEHPSAGPGAPAAAAARVADIATRGESADLNPRLFRRFKPVRATIALANAPEPTGAQIDLGRMLFFDKRLSRDHDLSCNSCHALDHFGVDNEPTSIGAKGVRGRRNSPTVYNAAGHFTAFWDGRVTNVEEQAKMPILNPAEMAMPNEKAVVARLAHVPGYVTAFHAAFPGDPVPVSYDNLGRAIGAFERKLVTPSRWDKFVAGNRRALTTQEISGLKLFMDLGCMTCHTGEFLGGTMFQKVGVAAAWPNQEDQGRYEVTKLPSDRMLFKVPSLRNVAKTAPYFHDGSAKTLEEAVTFMARMQIGEELSGTDVTALVSWLGSLTGELPAKYIEPPQLPPD